MDSIGQQLKAARERKGVTASQAAAATYLKVQHIEALEHDDYSRLTVPTYAKGFIRIYAEYLGLDPAPLLREYTTSPATGAPAAAAPTPPAGSIFKSPRRPLPGAPARPAWSPELITRLLQVAAGLVVLVLLIWIVRHSGCQRTPRAPVAVTPPPPVATAPVRPEAPAVAPVKREPAAPWVIVNEPPPPYLKRSNPATP